jgi:hypothetical protein
MLKIAMLVMTATLWTTTAMAACGTGDCAVAAFGQGGIASDGKAQGAHIERPSTLYPGETYFNTGNNYAGRIAVSNEGTIQGTERDGLMRGHTSGVFGDASGHL